jgi:hypothetical protein
MTNGCLCGAGQRLCIETVTAVTMCTTCCNSGYLCVGRVPVGYNYGNLVLQVGGVSNETVNMIMSPAGLGSENNCIGEGQQQL